MPKLSISKKEKISEQILHYLFTISPESAFTSIIAEELARDEEFIKALLIDLKSKSLVIEINKNSSGILYSRRQRWRLSNQAFQAYKAHQEKSKKVMNIEDPDF